MKIPEIVDPALIFLSLISKTHGGVGGWGGLFVCVCVCVCVCVALVQAIQLNKLTKALSLRNIMDILLRFAFFDKTI